MVLNCLTYNHMKMKTKINAENNKFEHKIGIVNKFSF